MKYWTGLDLKLVYMFDFYNALQLSRVVLFNQQQLYHNTTNYVQTAFLFFLMGIAGIVFFITDMRERGHCNFLIEVDLKRTFLWRKDVKGNINIIYLQRRTCFLRHIKKLRWVPICRVCILSHLSWKTLPIVPLVKVSFRLILICLIADTCKKLNSVIALNASID